METGKHIFTRKCIWLGGPPHSSRQEFLCLSGNIPKRIGEEKHEKTTVNLPNFNDASFCPASPPRFPLPILEYCQPAVQIGDLHWTYFWKVRSRTVADLLRGLTIFRYWKGKYRWASGEKWSIVENGEVDGGLFVLLFADSFRYVPAQTQKLLAGRMGRTP